MQISILPKTLLGRWSFGLIIAFILLFIAFQLLVASGQQGGETFLDNLLLTIPIFLAGACGISALITGLIGIIKSKERSILVFLATLLGVCVLIFLIGELSFPH